MVFSAPSRKSPKIALFLLAGVFGFVAASCLGVLELDSYDSASEQLCSLYDRCYGPEAFVGCRRHVAGQIEAADGDARNDFLQNIADCIDDCQHLSACLDQPLFCQTLRQSCAASAQCCGSASGVATCFDQSCCLVESSACSRDIDCCAGSCSGGKCQGSVTPVCAQNGASCNGSGDCCSGICTGGTCSNACAPRGSTCSANADCCSGKCSNGVCRKFGCFAAGDLCISDVDCCQDACDKSRGICGNAGCLGDGVPCSKDGDCCSGLLCNPADGTCGTLSCKKYGDQCGGDSECCGLFCLNNSCQCAPNGTACNDTEAYKCCSGVCENGSCVDCRSGGTACTDGNPCCSGSCNGTICCNDNCSHNICNPGESLSINSCSPEKVGSAASSCVATICADSPQCCCNGWDQSCVDKVASLCKLECP